MESFFKSVVAIRFGALKRLCIVLLTGVFMLVTTACTPADTAAKPIKQSAPEASQAEVDRAQSNLSDEAISEDTLSKQGPSRARESNGVVSPQ